MNTVSLFSKRFGNEFERLPVWLPGSKIDVGDVGELSGDGAWGRTRNLRDAQIDFEAEPGGINDSLNHTSGQGCKMRAGMSGTGADAIPGVPGGNVGIGFQFTEEASFALQARGCSVRRMKNVHAVSEELLNRAMRATWDKRWIVVTEVVTAQRFFLSVAAGRRSESSIDLGVQSGPADIANASLEARVAHQKNTATAWVSVTRPAPLMFRAIGVRQKFLRGMSTMTVPVAPAGDAWEVYDLNSLY